jgi:hypothetical protein
MKRGSLEATGSETSVTEYTKFASLTTEELLEAGLETLEKYLIDPKKISSISNVEDSIHTQSKLMAILSPLKLTEGHFSGCDFASNGHMIRGLLYGVEKVDFLNLDSGDVLHCPYSYLIASFRMMVEAFIFSKPRKTDLGAEDPSTAVRIEIKTSSKAEALEKWYELDAIRDRRINGDILSYEETVEILNVLFHDYFTRKIFKAGIMTVGYNCSFPQFAEYTYLAIRKKGLASKPHPMKKAEAKRERGSITDGDRNQLKDYVSEDYYTTLISIFFNVLKNLDTYNIMHATKNCKIKLQGLHKLFGAPADQLCSEGLTLKAVVEKLSYKFRLQDGFPVPLAKFNSIKGTNRCVITPDPADKNTKNADQPTNTKTPTPRTQSSPTPRQLPSPHPPDSERSMDPNFIHSLDAFILRRIVMSQDTTRSSGKVGLMTVHDFFNFPRIELFLYKDTCEKVFSEDLFDSTLLPAAREDIRASFYIIH